MSTRFDEVAPTEEIPLTFEFAAGLAAGETLDTPAIVVEVDMGTDAAAAAIVKSSQVVGTDVLVAVAGMLINTDYRITVTCTTSNAAKTLTVAGVLPVRRA